MQIKTTPDGAELIYTECDGELVRRRFWVTPNGNVMEWSGDHACRQVHERFAAAGWPLRCVGRQRLADVLRPHYYAMVADARQLARAAAKTSRAAGR